jgi:hypothetical protein
MIRCYRPHLTAGGSEGPRLRTATCLGRRAPVSALFRRIYVAQLEYWASVKRFVSLQFLNLRQSTELLGRGISPSQGRYLHKHRINADKHPCLEWDSNPRSQRSREQRHFILRPRLYCDRHFGEYSFRILLLFSALDQRVLHFLH